MDLDQLNESQRQAVLCVDAPMLVIAGAGSGKTRVLTYKIAHLLSLGMKPWQILALTFTNKAAREMQERIARQVGTTLSSGLWMGTFHSMFCRILRAEAALIGFGSDFTIYDTSDSKTLVASIIKEMGLDDKTYKPALVCSQISRAKNALVRPSDYVVNSRLRRADDAARMPLVHEVYARYAERCRSANAMDFDDILLYSWILLGQHHDVAEKYRQRFQYILVDEYQDTNYAQHQIVWLLAQQHQRICVVGDDAQSIYGFRGADIDNILHFQQQYSGTRLFKLEQNYRSTQTIVGAANSLIKHNRRQIEKDVFSQNGKGSPIEVYHAYSDADEANIIVRKIRQLAQAESYSYGNMAVLYRTNAQSRALEESLRREGVPYRIFGGLSFYQRKEVKDLIAYFRLSVNPYDEVALKRIINYPARGIGQTTVDKLFDHARTQGISVWQALQQPQDLGVHKGTITKLQSFSTLIASFTQQSAQADAYTLAMQIIKESGIQADVFSGRMPDDLSRQENLQELMDGINLFVQNAAEQAEGTLMTHYLQQVSLMSDQDQADDMPSEQVTLMTVHSAKGLEFDAVIVSGMEENLFPGQMSTEHPSQLEEERRLFYVAITRARHRLFLTHARTRFRYGKTEFCTPSRFLREIDPCYIKGAESETPFRKPAPAQPPLPPQRILRPASSLRPLHPTSSAAPSTPGLRVGTRILHDRFGAGTVLSVEGAGIDAKAHVRFDNAGEKQLLLRFAKIKIQG